RLRPSAAVIPVNSLSRAAAGARLPRSRSRTVTPSPRCGGPARPAASGFPRGFRAETITGSSAEARLAAAGCGPAGRRVLLVARPAHGEPPLPPVPGTGGERVLERVAPVLPGKAAPVRRGPLVAVDPHPRRPCAARPHERDVQSAV